MMPQGRKWKTGRSNVHKAPEQSQLSKTDTGALERNSQTRLERARSGDLTRHETARPIEQCHKGDNGKRATPTCTRHPVGHNLAKLISAPSNEMDRPKRARLGDLTRRAQLKNATREKKANGTPECAQAGTQVVTT